MYRDWKIEFVGGVYTASKAGHTSMTANNRVDIERKVDQRIANGGLRAIKVWYSDGSDNVTSMAANLTDDEMLSYFCIGKEFNIGRGANDNMVIVKRAEILI
jgi:hypothetical protein